MSEEPETDMTDIWGAFAIWTWGKDVPREVFEFQEFMKRKDSPLFQYVSGLEKEIAPLKEKVKELETKVEDYKARATLFSMTEFFKETK